MIKQIILRIKKIPKFLIVILQICISIVFIFLIIRKIDFSELPDTILNIKFSYILILSVLSLLISLLVQPYRFYLLVRAKNYPVRFRDMLNLYVSTISLKTLLPFKTGILVRSVILQKHFNMKLVTSFILNIVLMISNLIVFIILYFIILYFKNSILIILISLLFLIIMTLIIRLTDLNKKFNTIYYSIIYCVTSVIFNSIDIIILAGLFSGYHIVIKIPHELSGIVSTLIFSELPITYNGIGLREYLLFEIFKGVTDYNNLFSISTWYFIIYTIIPALAGLIFIKRILLYIKNK